VLDYFWALNHLIHTVALRSTFSDSVDKVLVDILCPALFIKVISMRRKGISHSYI